MNKKTSNEQFILLAEEASKYPMIARGVSVFGSSKLKVEQFWEATAFKLNYIGPPERTTTEWKKVFSDLKLRTKRKVSANKNLMRETGGGPFYENKLNGYEETVDSLLTLSTSAAPEGIAFGLNYGKTSEHNISPTNANLNIQQSSGKTSASQINNLHKLTQPSASQQSVPQMFTIQQSTPKPSQQSVPQSPPKPSQQSVTQLLTTQKPTTHESPLPKKRKLTTIGLLEHQLENQNKLIEAVNVQNSLLNTNNSILLQLVNVLKEKLQ